MLTNAGLTGNAINPVAYMGIRGELLFKFNDDRDVLLSQTYQNMDAQGVFYDQPTHLMERLWPQRGDVEGQV